MRRTAATRLWLAPAALAALVAVAVPAGAKPAGAEPAGDSPAPARTAHAKDANPCLRPKVRRERGLLCPDLRMRPPFDITRDRLHNGKPVLRAGNSIDSVGHGPAELSGRRSGATTMDAFQRVHRKGGGTARFDTGAELKFKHIPGQGPYWKFRNAARFELWLLDRRGNRVRRVRVGTKVIYCLRDYERTRPRRPRSPEGQVYPACSQDPGLQRVILGTSVGWSDIYPQSYHEQYIRIDRIPRFGCYAYVHIADPRNGIFELNERNNEASTVVFLTPKGRYLAGRCDGVHDRALPRSQTAGDTEVHVWDAEEGGEAEDGGDPGDGGYY